MTMRITGLNSGLDTDSIIEALVSAYSVKTEKYTKAQTKLSWKQDAWKSLNTKIYSMYTNVSNLRFSGAYSLKKTSISDASKAAVSVSNSAINGSQKLEIRQTSQTAALTGGKIDATSVDTTLGKLGYTGDATELVIKDKDGNEKSKISIDQNTKISSVVNQLQSAGLSASFDTKQQRFYISATGTGSENDFNIGVSTSEISESKANDAKAALSFLGLSSASDNLEKSGFTLTDVNTNSKLSFSFTDQSGIDNEANQAKQSALFSKLKAGSYSVTTDSTGAATYSLSGYTFYDGKVYEASDTEHKTALATYEEKNAGSLIADAASGKYTNDDGDEVSSLTREGSFYDYSSAMVKYDGLDAEIILNGVKYTSSTNAFSINGLSIDVYEPTDSEVTITTETDNQGIYDKIKDFLTEYNSLINEMNKMYNAESSKGYEPLTDEEKDAMNDTEIEKWEEKIKGALLRRDTTLNSVMSSMINSMMNTYEINGKKYSLSSFKIMTLGYLNAADNEEYAYHIDGDEDDSNVSSKEDALMKAIEEDPDTVIEFMKQLTSGLYKSIDDKMKSTSVSSAYTVYNDKELNSQYSEYSTLISQWDDKLSDKEDFYYSKFAAMESALATLQSNASSLTNLFS